MKKILIFIALLFNIININALEDTKTYYTEYGTYQPGYQKPSDLVELKEVEKYKYYNEELVMGDYYIENENPIEFPFKKENDIFFTEYSQRSTIYPLEKPNRSISTEEIFYYQDMKEIRYIFIHDLKGSYGAFRLSEIEVFAGENKIDFTTTCGVCTNKTIHNIINDGSLIYRNDALIYNDSYLMIDLNNYYPADSISLNLYIYEISNTPQYHSVSFTNEPNLDTVFLKTSRVTVFKSSSQINSLKDSYTIDDMDIVNPLYYDEVETFESVYTTKTRTVKYFKYYTYSDVLYRYYGIKENYSEDYLDQATDMYPNKSNISKIYYEYRNRDKIVLKNPLLLKNSKDLNTLILECSSECYIVVDGKLKVGENRVKIKIGNYYIDEVIYLKKINKHPLNKKTNNENVKKKEEPLIQFENNTEKVNNKKLDIVKMVAVPSIIMFLLPTYIYFKSEYNKN